MADDAPLLLITSGDISPHLEAELAGSGFPVVHAQEGRDGETSPLRFESCEAVREGLAEICAGHPAPRAILVVHAGRGAFSPKPIERFSDEGWEAAVQTPLRNGLFTFQALHALFPEGPPPMFQMGPVLGVTGAATFVPLAALVEGQRALGKLVARQWGGQGWRVNWLGVSASVFMPGLATESPPLPGVRGPAIGHRPTMADEIAPLIALLSQGPARILTGSTLFLDGGDWMLP